MAYDSLLDSLLLLLPFLQQLRQGINHGTYNANCLSSVNSWTLVVVSKIRLDDKWYCWIKWYWVPKIRPYQTRRCLDWTRHQLNRHQASCFVSESVCLCHFSKDRDGNPIPDISFPFSLVLFSLQQETLVVRLALGTAVKVSFSSRSFLYLLSQSTVIILTTLHQHLYLSVPGISLHHHSTRVAVLNTPGVEIVCTHHRSRNRNMINASSYLPSCRRKWLP